MSVLKIYMLLHNGHLPPGFESACLSHQLDFMGTLPLYNAQNLFGNTCAINDGSFGARYALYLISWAPSSLTSIYD
jgi:hypothetical protein